MFKRSMAMVMMVVLMCGLIAGTASVVYGETGVSVIGTRFIPGYTLTAQLDGGSAATGVSWRRYASENAEEYTMLTPNQDGTYTPVNADGGSYIQAVVSKAGTEYLSPKYSIEKAISEQYKNEFHDYSFTINKVRPELNSFKVPGEDGKERDFSLVDYQEDGSVYVIANEEYANVYYYAGKYTPDIITFKNSVVYKQACKKIYEGSKTPDEPGYGTISLVLPKGIRDHIQADAQWLTERGPNTADSNGTQPTAPNDFVETYPVGILSAYEITKYAVDTNRLYHLTTTNNEWLRTPNVAINPEQPHRYLSPNGKIVGAPTNMKMQVRPTFYLKNSFFKSIKVSDAGDEIWAYIASLNTDTELEALGYTAKEIEHMAGLRDRVLIKALKSGETDLDAVPADLSEIGAEYQVNRFEFSRGSFGKATLIAALYRNQILQALDVQIVEADVYTAGKTVNFSFDTTTVQGDTIKIFVLEDMQNISPMGRPLER